VVPATSCPPRTLTSSFGRLAPRDFPSGEKLHIALSITGEQLSNFLWVAQTFHLSQVVLCATFLESRRNTCLFK
jgi:hypothetical protein